MSSVVITVEGALGRVHLNRPDVLNSLDLEMVRLIEAGLDRLEADPAVRAIALTGEGDRALCAGGDIKMLWSTGRTQPEKAMTFWAEEYRLDARIHRLQKPWIAVMDGICMGGGVGLSVHGRHRVVTERVKFAMPETGIGYFPDVGGTWALARAPQGLGLWIGLTGATIGAADVIAAGLADAMVPVAAIPALLADLAAGVAPEAAIAAHAADPGPSRLRDNAGLIEAAFSAGDMGAILAALETDGSAFAAETAALMQRKSPTSLILTLHLLRAAAGSPDLETCLDRELAADALILKGHDFYEGVRAAVIDKDRNPKWHPVTLEAVDTAALLAGLQPLPSLFAAV
ncbi:MAG: enoyl-CoA hydratase/isomerase family protein [Paracoccaceae bacterium]